MDGDIGLVPNEGFVEETNADKSKKFTCKQCAKVCKTEHSVKQHIGKVHKNDRGLKRTASSRIDTGKKKSQKLIQDDDLYTDGPLQSTQLGALMVKPIILLELELELFIFSSKYYIGAGARAF